MSNSVLPALPGLTWSNTKTPTFTTKIQTSVGMSEVRAAFSPYPRRRYTLTYNFLRDWGALTELKTLYGFYCQMQGAFDTFLYDDPEDDSVTSQLIGTGDGSTTAFQLVRTYGGFTEPVYNPHAAPQIFVNGVLKTLGIDYTITNGVVTFAVAPGIGLPVTWTGTYYWRCRFEQDTLAFEELANLVWKQSSMAFLTVLNA
jgi:uncharacterized protein (TIGR02217 family)